YVATVLWGDGGTSAGTITHLVGDPATTFTVLGTHTYTEEGSYNILAQVTDTDGLPLGSPSAVPPASASPVNTVTVVDPPLTGTATTVSATEGAPLINVVVGSFTDLDPNGQMLPPNGSPGSTHNDYVATIDWGDGTTSAGTIV